MVAVMGLSRTKSEIMSDTEAPSTTTSSGTTRQTMYIMQPTNIQPPQPLSFEGSLAENWKHFLQVSCANVLGIPIIATEHKGCGATVPEIDTSTFKDKIFNKTTFSMMGCPTFAEELNKMANVKSVVIFGVMADVCIYNTTLELLEKNYQVHVMADGVSSDHNCERMICLKRLQESGAIVSLSKATLLNLIKTTDHPRFAAIDELVNNAPPDQGLINTYGI